MTICLSKLLNINYAEVPFYGKESAHKNWLSKLTKWSNKKGFRMSIIFDVHHFDTADKKIIGVGRSPSGKDNDHAVIVNEELQVIFDPTYNKRRSIRNLGYILVFEEL